MGRLKTDCDLYPCPFCGGIKGKHLEMNGPNRYGKYWVSCRSCACTGPWAKSEIGAGKSWNGIGPLERGGMK
jgi:hypothetical protein